MPLRKLNTCKESIVLGCSYSTQCKDFVCATGMATMDYYIGGGLINRSIVTLQDSLFESHLSRSFMRNFASAGANSADRIIFVAKNQSSIHPLLSIIKENSGNNSDSNELSSSADEGNLKIAWRYQLYPKAKDLDLEAVVDTNNPSLDKNIFLNSYELGPQGLKDSLRSLLTMEERVFTRIIFLDFASVNFFSDEYCQNSYVDFILFLKALLTMTECNVACLFQLSQSDCCDRSFAGKLQYLTDYYLMLVTFDQLPKRLVQSNNLFSKDHSGFMKICKIPFVNNSYPLNIEDSKFGVKKRKDQLIFERLHLPPDLSETANRSEVKADHIIEALSSEQSRVTITENELW